MDRKAKAGSCAPGARMLEPQPVGRRSAGHWSPKGRAELESWTVWSLMTIRMYGEVACSPWSGFVFSGLAESGRWRSQKNTGCDDLATFWDIMVQMALDCSLLVCTCILPREVAEGGDEMRFVVGEDSTLLDQDEVYKGGGGGGGGEMHSPPEEEASMHSAENRTYCFSQVMTQCE